jgi:hypothetical protein
MQGTAPSSKLYWRLELKLRVPPEKMNQGNEQPDRSHQSQNNCSIVKAPIATALQHFPTLGLSMQSSPEEARDATHKFAPQHADSPLT